MVSPPIAVYNRETDKDKIIKNYKNVSVIYQWVNLITGEIYVGSRINGAERLGQYYMPSHLNRNRRIMNSIRKYSHSNFAVAILEIVTKADITPVDKAYLLEREQHYLNILFNSSLFAHLNLASKAGNTLGFKHTEDFRNNRKIRGNPMHGCEYLPEFKEQQTRDKSGSNNLQYGVEKSPETIAKLSKMIYVYKAGPDGSEVYVGSFKTVECKKEFRIWYDTLKKPLLDGKSHKGYYFRLVKKKMEFNKAMLAIKRLNCKKFSYNRKDIVTNK